MKARRVAMMLIPILSILAVPFVEMWTVEAGPFDRSKDRWYSQATVQISRNSVRAEHDGRDLKVLFPVENRSSASEKLSYFVLVKDLEGNRVAHREGRYSVPHGSSYLEVIFPAFDLSTRTDAEYVVSYIVRAGDERVIDDRRSLFHLLPHPALTTSIPDTVFVDTPTRIPVRVVDGITRKPYANQQVSISVKGNKANTSEYLATTNSQGLATVTLKPRQAGKLAMTVTANVGGSRLVKLEATARAESASKVFLSTDKPMYQPGQTMHIRALVLKRPDLKPAQKEKTLLEVYDAKGNKVYKAQAKTNRFGVASTTFTLGNQIHMGSYRIFLKAGATETEKTVTVDRYVLPKFDVNTRLNKEFYLPGDKLSGTLAAKYFFGKPVAGGSVKIRVLDYQAKWVPVRVIEAKTNDSGILEFSYRLPERLIGQPAQNGNAMLMLEVNVEDTGGQKRQLMKSVTVAKKAAEILVIPESGAVVPGVKNRFFVALADPSGNPMAGKVQIQFSDSTGGLDKEALTLNASGLATIAYKPARRTQSVSVFAVAEATTGAKTNQRFTFTARPADAQVLVRTSKALLKVGDQLSVELLASGAVTDAFLDVTRENQTVATATIPIKEGRGAYRLDIDNTMAGTLAVSAYVLSDRGEYVRDSRVVYVKQATGLNVDIAMDKEEYKPAGKAKLQFKVSDTKGSAVQAALGIHVVDEAVFALSEARPGLLKLYFALEEELLKPTYQIGRGIGATLGQLILGSGDDTPEEPVQRNVEAAIASQGDVAVRKDGVSSWAKDVRSTQEALANYATFAKGKMLKAVQNQSCSYRNEKEFTDVVKKAYKAHRIDPWGHKIHLKVNNWVAQFDSAGPDGRFDTGDDVKWTITHYEPCNYRYYRGGLEGNRMVRGGGVRMLADEAIPMAATGAVMDGTVMKKEAPRHEFKTKTAEAESSEDTGGDRDKDDSSGGGDTIRVRSWFPETLFVENCLITDEKGEAELAIPLADSITSWRVSTVASDRSGNIGGKDTPLKVFQDFFVDIDFPVFLTRNDEITFPVVVYNYLKTNQTVEIQVRKEAWFDLKDSANARLELRPGEVRSVQFPVKVKQVGWHSLTVIGKGSEGFNDAVQRTVEVRPDGKEIASATGGKFKTNEDSISDDRVTLKLEIPENAVKGSPKAYVQILPGLTSHVVQGMESMLKLPGGCFEQTTSSAWPNVLALRYLKETEQSTPEIEMKAMQYVNVGYQRILTFECQSGGFNWWQGDNPGNAILSAVGIMMLKDTSRVYNAVDENVIKRSFRYLKKTQKSDGSWGEERHLHAGNENLGAGSLRGTCYITWAINEGGFSETSTARKALNYIEGNISSEKDLYTMGLCAIALSSFDKPSSHVRKLVERIRDAAVVKDDTIHWETKGMTIVNSWGNSANVEVSALMALAYLRTGIFKNDVPKVINYLVASKDPQGNWGYNTQATVLALKVFLEAATMEAGETRADVNVTFNGDKIGARHFDNFNKDVVWQVELPGDALKERNELVLDYNGKGNLGYQFISSYHLPEKKKVASEGPLKIDVQYDRRQIKVNETVKVKATFTMRQKNVKGMILATLGVPPGFDVMTEDLELMKKNGAIQKYELTGRQVLLYLDELAVNEPTVVEYRLKARYPVKAQTGSSEVGFYYNRDVNARQPSQEIRVK